MTRFVHDEKFDTNFLFPDTLVITIHSIEKSGNMSLCTLGLKFTVDSADLSATPNSQAAVLANAFISFKRPDLVAAIKSFRFVKTDELEGNAIINCISDYTDKLLDSLQNNPAFLSPYYKGTLENINITQPYAQFDFPALQISALNSMTGGIVSRIKYMESQIQLQDKSPANQLLLLEKTIDRFGQFNRVAKDGNDYWIFTLDTGNKISVSLSKVLESNQPIEADPTVTKVTLIKNLS